MIAIDISLSEAKKLITSEKVKFINKILENKENEVSISKLIYLDEWEVVLIFEIISNGIDSIEIIYSISEKVELYDFRVQLLKELNKIGLISKGKS